MALRDLPAEVEAEPAAGAVARVRAALERLEYELALIGRDARTGIPNTDQRAVALDAEGDMDRAAVRSVLVRVVDEVPHHDLEEPRIRARDDLVAAVDVHGPPERRPETRAHLAHEGLERNAFGDDVCELETRRVEDVAQERHEARDTRLGSLERVHDPRGR